MLILKTIAKRAVPYVGVALTTMEIIVAVHKTIRKTKRGL